MKQSLITLLITSLLIMSGCKTCPLPKDKKITYPSKTRTNIQYTTAKINFRHFAWWKKIHDPKLNQLIAKALLCNNNIQSAAATIEQAQAQLKAALYAWLPTLDGKVNGLMLRTWDNKLVPEGLTANPLSSTLTKPSFQGYYLGFVPSYTINLLNTSYHVKSAEASLAMQQAQAQSIKLAVISQMAGAYFMLLSQREQLQLEKILLQDLQELYQLEQIRFQRGMSDIEALTNLDQQLAQEEAKLPQIENIIAQTENTIHLLINENPGSIKTKQRLDSIPVNHLIPTQLPTSVLKNRPDVCLALANIKQAQAQLGIAYAEFFPSLSLSNLLGPASLDLRRVLKLSTGLWLGQVTASTKIFNPSAYANIKAAKAGIYASIYNSLQTLKSVFKEVDDKLTTEQKNRATLAKIRLSDRATQKSYRIALEQYQAGAKDKRTLINAKINLERSKLNVVQQKAALLDSIVQVFNALAAGSEARV